MKLDFEKLYYQSSKYFRIIFIFSAILFLISVSIPIFGLEQKQLIDKTIEQFTKKKKDIDYWIIDKSVDLKKYVFAKSFIKYKILGFSPSKDYYLGQNGMFVRQKAQLQEKDTVVPIARPLNDLLGIKNLKSKDLSQIRHILEERKKFLNSKGIKYLVVFIPRKSTIYPEIYPKNIRNKFTASNLQKLTKRLENNSNINFVNLTKSLLDKKNKTTYPLYYKTDGHWNYYGALVGYQSTMKKVNEILHKNSPILKESDFRISVDSNWCHKRFLRQTGLCIKDKKFTFFPNPLNAYQGISILQNTNGLIFQPKKDIDPKDNLIFTKGIPLEFPKILLTNKNNQKSEYTQIFNNKSDYKSLLILGESFSEKMIYYLSNHFSKTFRIREVMSFDKNFFNIDPKITGKVDIVIQSIVEGVLHKDAKMSNPDFNKNLY